MGLDKVKHHVLDTTSVIAVGYRRDKRHSDFLASYCAARKMHYFGLRSCTLDDISSQAELLPANVDERAAANEILDRLPIGSLAIGDKGFIGQEWQGEWLVQVLNLLHRLEKSYDKVYQWIARKN